MAYFGAVDIGGTKIAVGIGTQDGDLLVSGRFPTPKDDAQTAMDMIAHQFESLSQQVGIEVEKLSVIGVGTPGPLAGTQLLKTANLPKWEGIDLAAGLSMRLGVGVAVQNDATSAGLAEWYYGAGQGTKDMVYITVSTGIGGGIVAGGRVLGGVQGNAGEVGHLVIERHGPTCQCGNQGCLESLASGTAIGRLGQIRQADSPYLKNMKRENITAATVFAGAKAEDLTCQNIVDQTAEYLGLGVGYLINLFNPERVVMGGGVMAHAGQEFLNRISQWAKSYAMPVLYEACSLHLAQLGDDSGLIGALAVAMQGLAK